MPCDKLLGSPTVQVMVVRTVAGVFAVGAGLAILTAGTAEADTDSDPVTATSATSETRRAAASRTATRARPPAQANQSVQSTILARRPVLAYNAAQNVQSAGGVIGGTLNPTQANGYPLAITVTGAPRRGSVSVAADGTFTYTPTPDFAATGGTDTFSVTADDRPDNPQHWHGLQTFLAPDGGHTATADVTVLENPGPAIPPSVLATTDQLAAEAAAARLAGSLPMRLATLVLKAGWLLAAGQNYARVGGPDAENLARLDQAVAEYATAAAFQVQLLDSADPKVIQQVSPPHDWYLQSVPGSRIWYDNPDTIYRFVGVNSASSYVLSGRFESTPADTNFSVLTGLGGTTAANLNGRDVVLNPDGSFTITASSTPPAPGQTNHLQLPPGTTLITTRNTLSDWNTQTPMSLSILKLTGPPPSLFSQLGGFAIPGIGSLVAANPLLTSLVSLIPPLPTPNPVQSLEAAVIMLLLGISGENQYMQVATTDPDTGELRAPNTLSDPARNAQFLSTQLQSAGYFQLDDDQALVVTVDPGNARYFNLPVTDDWTITGDYWNEQTSLNVGQAIADPDGRYTLVVSPTDPGVANWVSTGGLNQGTISMRFQDFDLSERTPKVQTQVVALDQLAAALPPTTVYVTAAERQLQIARRQLGYSARYAPYPQA